MNESVVLAVLKSFFPGVFGAFVTIFAKKKEAIKLVCFATLETVILLLIGGFLGWVGGEVALKYYKLTHHFDIYMARFLIGAFGFVIIKEGLNRIPIWFDKVEGKL